MAGLYLRVTQEAEVTQTGRSGLVATSVTGWLDVCASILNAGSLAESLHIGDASEWFGEDDVTGPQP